MVSYVISIYLVLTQYTFIDDCLETVLLPYNRHYIHVRHHQHHVQIKLLQTVLKINAVMCAAARVSQQKFVTSVMEMSGTTGRNAQLKIQYVLIAQR